MRAAARIYAAAECAAITALALIGSEMTAPAFMGFFTTAALAGVGWFGKNTDRSHQSKSAEGGTSGAIH